MEKVSAFNQLMCQRYQPAAVITSLFSIIRRIRYPCFNRPWVAAVGTIRSIIPVVALLKSDRKQPYA